MKSSFIIPVFNCGDCLHDIVNDIINIHLKQYEVILIDDGSTDHSGQLCDQLSTTYDSIKVIHQRNQGVSAARNQGIAAAEGELVIFLDADDRIDSKQLTPLIGLMEANDDLDLLIFDHTFDYYRHGNCYRQDIMTYNHDGILNHHDWTDNLQVLFNVNAISPVWNKIYRKKILTEHQVMFNRQMFLYEDLEFSIRYLVNCNNIYHSTNTAYHYRQAEDEGNAKRRLMRIEHLPDLIHQIALPLLDLAKTCNADTESIASNEILLKLYLVLAREKISVSNRKQIKQICVDMCSWYEDNKIDSNPDYLSDSDRKYLNTILQKRIGQLLINNYYIDIRHKFAVFIKSSKLYRRLKKSDIK